MLMWKSDEKGVVRKLQRTRIFKNIQDPPPVSLKLKLAQVGKAVQTLNICSQLHSDQSSQAKTMIWRLQSTKDDMVAIRKVSELLMEKKEKNVSKRTTYDKLSLQST